MDHSYSHFPIIICGAGSVGLMLAAELAFRNQKVLLIEKSPHLNDHPRANAVANRSMEYFRRLGIAKKFKMLEFLLIVLLIIIGLVILKVS